MINRVLLSGLLLICVQPAFGWNISNPKLNNPPFSNTSQEEARLKKIGVLSAELFDIFQGKREDELKRLQHHKIQGCLRGTLEVSPRLSKNFETPVFKKGVVHQVWSRFTNINKDDDSESDLHGFGLRVLDPDRKAGDLSGQDFLANDTRKHFVRSPEELMDFLHFVSGNRLPTVDLLKLTANAALQSHKRHSLIEDSYHSRTHFRFGNHNVRYGFFPCVKKDFTQVERNENHLSKNLREEAKKGICFEFKIQVHNDKTDPLINDYTQEWNSAYQTVAKIKFPPQDPRMNKATCENLSFDTWRTVNEHRPLGFLNKARWYIYKTSRTKAAKK